MLDTVALTRLRIWVADERGKSLEQLAGGQLNDMRQYGYSCGYIKALDDVLIVLEQTIADIQGG